MVLFNRNINIGEGKKYDISQVSKDGITAEERAKMEKKNDKMIDIFNAYDLDNSGDLNQEELAYVMKDFARADQNEDNKLTADEFEAMAEEFNATEGLPDITGKDMKEFFKGLFKATKNDEKDDLQFIEEKRAAEDAALLSKEITERAALKKQQTLERREAIRQQELQDQEQ